MRDAWALSLLGATALCPRLCSCVPSPFCFEAGLVYGQGLLLLLRSLLTEYISRLEGMGGRWIIQQNTQRECGWVDGCMGSAVGAAVW